MGSERCGSEERRSEGDCDNGPWAALACPLWLTALVSYTISLAPELGVTPIAIEMLNYGFLKMGNQPPTGGTVTGEGLPLRKL